jgi:uncharacterized damage-inducible protein DinB
MRTKEDIIKQLQELQEGPLWLNENFKKKLAPIADELAFKRPLPEIHSVAELISHITVWMDACLDRMNCIPNTLQDNDVNDWKTNETLMQKGWTVLLEEFYKAHRRLIEFTDTCGDDFLNRQYQTTDFTNKDILFGLIQHDAYHMGQLGLTIKLLRAQLKEN